MKILAFDGCAKVASVAVLENERTIAEYSIDNGLTQSELLLPMAEAMLKNLGLCFDDIELYAASAGPGSFTGVRIGISLIKGLAFARGVPCVTPSTLDSLAENLRGLPGIIVPVMDARRSQVYSATYLSSAEDLKALTPDRAIAIKDLAEELSSCEYDKIYLVGDGYDVARAGLISHGLKIEDTPVILRNENAASVGRAAYRLFLEGKAQTDAEILPTYLRLPQAERERIERENKRTSK